MAMVWTPFIYHGNLDDLMSFATETLRPMMKRFEAEGWIRGYNFSFYSQDPHMSLRLDLAKKHQREVRKELKKLGIKPEAGEYLEQDKVAKFYELGSRWAFMLHDQIENGRFQKEWIRDENFTLTFHGLCNSLLFGYYEEIVLYLKAIGRIGVTQGRFDEIKNELSTINQKCKQWFLRANIDSQQSKLNDSQRRKKNGTSNENILTSE